MRDFGRFARRSSDAASVAISRSRLIGFRKYPRTAHASPVAIACLLVGDPKPAECDVDAGDTREPSRSGAWPANYTEDLGRESVGFNRFREDARKRCMGQAIVRFVASDGDDGNGAGAHFDLLDQPPTIPPRHRQIRHDDVIHHNLRQSFKAVDAVSTAAD